MYAGGGGRRKQRCSTHKHFVAPVGAPGNLWNPSDVSNPSDFLHLLPSVLFGGD